MSARWEAILCTPLGARIAYLGPVTSAQIVYRANDAGAFQIGLAEPIDPKYLQRDNIVDIWRAADEKSPLKRLAVGFLKKWRFTGTKQSRSTILVGPDQNDLLAARIVAYYAGSSQSQKTDYADDMLKEVVYENFSSGATDTARSWLGNGLTIQADAGAGPSVTKGFAYKYVISALQDIAALSAQNGTDLYFGLTPVQTSSSQIGFRFETAVGQPGQDRTDKVVFSEERGNLGDDAYLEYDYSDERTYVYAGGPREGAGRLLGLASDADRIGQSAWGRREYFLNDTSAVATSDTDMNPSAEAELTKHKPRLRFGGTPLDTEQARFGLDWGFGDKVTASYMGLQFDGVISTGRISLDKDGSEKVEARLEIEQ